MTKPWEAISTNNEGEDELSHTVYRESTTADHQDQEPTQKTSTKVQGSPVCEGEDELSHSVHSQSMTAKKHPPNLTKHKDRLSVVNNIKKLTNSTRQSSHSSPSVSTYRLTHHQ